MKRIYLTAVIAGAMFFSVESATAQVYENQGETTTEQTQQKSDFHKIEEQDLPDVVRQALERDHQGATLTEVYSADKDGEVTYKLVITTQEGQSQDLYADAQGNWVQKDERDSE